MVWVPIRIKGLIRQLSDRKLAGTFVFVFECYPVEWVRFRSQIHTFSFVSHRKCQGIVLRNLRLWPRQRGGATKAKIAIFRSSVPHGTPNSGWVPFVCCPVWYESSPFKLQKFTTGPAGTKSAVRFWLGLVIFASGSGFVESFHVIIVISSSNLPRLSRQRRPCVQIRISFRVAT